MALKSSVLPMNLQSQKPSDGTYAGALRGVQDRDYCHSVAFRERQGHASISRDKAHPKLVEFERGLVRQMRHFNVPMFAEVFWDQMSVEIIHCRYGWNIPEKAWSIFGHLGKEVAAKIRSDIVRDEAGKVVGRTRYSFQWGGDMTKYAPSYWRMTACVE